MARLESDTALAHEYATRFSASRLLHARAVASLAGASTHDSWRFDPFPLQFTDAWGAHKRDADGNVFVDFWTGHGSLLLGHRHPAVETAVAEQLARATHLGGAHPLQVEWAERVTRLIPSAERVRFAASGTEATLLALRVARSFTGRAVILRIDGHFHGWHDEALARAVPPGAGINPGTAENVVVLPFHLDVIAEALADLEAAALILEPGGGGSGALPWSAGDLAVLRELTTRHGTLLIFDEVISAFRYAPGGVQALSGVLPDITVLAKILAGGLPGAAVAGRADVMSVFGTRLPHTGTFNANPLSAAAGVATLDIIADGAAQVIAERACERLVQGVNAAAERRGHDLRLFRQSSVFHIVLGGLATGAPAAPSPAVFALHRQFRDDYVRLRRALLLEGVDAHLVHGWVSAAHTDEAVDDAVRAFARAMER
jgi:glutamate-1-semialdehyde 2,1-aminomutase